MTKGFTCFSLLLMIIFMRSGVAAAAHDPATCDGAVVTAIRGTAQVFTRGRTGHLLKKGDKLKRGQVIRVGGRSRVELRFPDGTVMRLSEKSRLVMSEVQYDSKTDKKKMTVDLSIGKLWAKVKKLATPDSSVEVKTVNAVAGVRGTVYRVNVEEDNSAMLKCTTARFTLPTPRMMHRGQTRQAHLMRSPVRTKSPRRTMRYRLRNGPPL